MQNLCRPRLIETVLRRRPSGRIQSAAGVTTCRTSTDSKHLMADGLIWLK